MKYKLRYKIITFASLAFLALITLASCAKTKISASIDGDAVYASSGNYQITNKELWDELKWNSYDTINEKIDEAILKDEMAEARQAISYINGETADVTLPFSKLKRYLDFYELRVLTEIFNAAEIDTLEDIPATEYNKKVQTFIDTVYLEDGEAYASTYLALDQIKSRKIDLFVGTKYETSYYFKEFYDRYTLDLAKKIFSNNVLKDNIADYDADASDKDDLYYTDSEIVQYQKENYQFSADRHAVIIRFTNSNEISSTFKAFGIKVYENNFYFIPSDGKTITKYSTYYDDFTIEDPKNSAKCINLTALGGDNLIFELYLQMYNYIYSYRDAIPTVVNIDNNTTDRRNITEAIISEYKQGNLDAPEERYAAFDEDIKEALTYDQEELDDISLDFKLYVSRTLKVNPDIADEETRYSTSGQSYSGDYNYMAFKISEEALEDWYYLCDDEYFEADASNVEIDTSNEAVAAYKQELIEEMMWDEITDSYIDQKYSDAKSNAKLYFYDGDVEILYASKKSSYSKTHKDAPASNVLFTVVYNKKKTNVTINEIYDEMEKTSGTTTAIDLLSKKAIKDTDEYAKTNEDRADYKERIELLLAYFANGSLSGYDSSLGKYNFLKLYFHSTDIDAIVDDYYRVNDATAKLLTDYANNTAFYEMLQYYATFAYNKSFTVTASNLLVYVDMDEDGEADTDFDWNTVVKNDTKTYAELAVELIQKFVVRMNDSSSASSTLSTLVEEYQGCQRFSNGIDQYDPSATEYDPTNAETRWAEYKRAGLYVSTTEYTDVKISSIETTTDNTIPSTIIKNRIHYLFDNISLFDENEVYPSTYVDDEFYKDSASGFVLDNGYGLLVLTSIVKRSSAEFKATDDVNGIYSDIVVEYDDVIKRIENIYNEGIDANSTPTINQIVLFVYEYLNYGTSSFFPSSVQSFISDFIMPTYERYADSATQRELYLNKLLSGTVDFADDNNDARFAEISAINKRVADSYLANDDDANLYPDWWTKILALGDGE